MKRTKLFHRSGYYVHIFYYLTILYYITIYNFLYLIKVVLMWSLNFLLNKTIILNSLRVKFLSTRMNKYFLQYIVSLTNNGITRQHVDYDVSLTVFVSPNSCVYFKYFSLKMKSSRYNVSSLPV